VLDGRGSGSPDLGPARATVQGFVRSLCKNDE
jgi:hypothetical protein